jgi:hypothetical protein
MNYDNDQFAGPRGIAWGLAFSVLIWTAIYFCAGLFF